MTWDNTTVFPTGQDWDEILTPGSYGIWSANNAPKYATWNLDVLRTPQGGNVIQRATSWSVPGEVFVRRRNAGVWGAWKPVVAPTMGGADVSIHQHEMRLSDLRQRVGAPRMGGKAAVTLICDHGTNNFASIVMPALQASGLKCTLALNSQMYAADYTHAAHENATTWTQIKGWHDNSGIEIANHGRTHKDATGESAIRTEIEGGRQELETNLPGVKIDTFVQIGTTGTGTKWDGFNDAITIDRYWETYAGRVVLDSHALATGQVPHGGTPNRVYPLDGHPVQGASGYWLDGGQTAIDTAKTKVDQAVTAGGGVILRLHPYLIDWANQITTQQLTDFFTYLKGRQDAGELNVLTYREWSLAVAW